MLTGVLVHSFKARMGQTGVLTGVLVHSFKARLPEVDGIENIPVDTHHGVLNYTRPGADSKVQWAPPSALRRIDHILCDEGSQCEDKEWDRLFQVVKEQPHSPFLCIVADFQQLQKVASSVIKFAHVQIFRCSLYVLLGCWSTPSRLGCLKWMA